MGAQSNDCKELLYQLSYGCVSGQQYSKVVKKIEEIRDWSHAGAGERLHEHADLRGHAEILGVFGDARFASVFCTIPRFTLHIKFYILYVLEQRSN